MEKTFIFFQLHYFTLFAFVFGIIFAWHTKLIQNQKEWDQFSYWFIRIFVGALLIEIFTIISIPDFKSIGIGQLILWFLKGAFLSYYGFMLLSFGIWTTEQICKKESPDEL